MATNPTETVEAAPSAPSGAARACTHHPAFQLHQPEPGCKCGKLRPLRKLHAIIGLWLGLFLCLHLAISLTGFNPSQYQATVNFVHRSLAYLPGALLLLVFLPFLLQATSGLYLSAKEGLKYNVKRCDRGGKLRFFLQRWSGLAMLAFLFVHIGNMHGWLPLTRPWTTGQTPAGFASTALPDQAAFPYTAFAFHPWNSASANSITIALLLLGALAAAFHAANGAWSGAILWKLVTTPRGKAWSGYLCAALGIALSLMGALAWYAFALSPNAQAALAIIGR